LPNAAAPATPLLAENPPGVHGPIDPIKTPGGLYHVEIQ
jgi:hypothetical protein